MVLKLIFKYYHTLAAGLHQVTYPEMGVILQVTEGEILIFSFKKQLRGNVNIERKCTRNGMNNFGSNKKFKNLLQGLIEMIEC